MDKKQASEIAIGFSNLLKKKLVILDEDKEQLGLKRMEVCKKCKNANFNLTCRKCGCYLPAKVLSPNSKCPIKLW